MGEYTHPTVPDITLLRRFCSFIPVNAHILCRSADGDDVDLRITEKPVYDILPGRPEAGLDDDAQLNPDGSGHQPDQGMLEVGGEILACRLAEDHGYARRRVNDEASAALRLRRRLRQLGRPASS